MVLYWSNLFFSTSLFLFTVTIRNRIIYLLVNDVSIAYSMLSIFNAVMMVLLFILVGTSIYLGTKRNRSYYLFAVLGGAMLITSLIGIFLFPESGLLT